MTPAMVVICSGLLTFGVPLLLALREIYRTGAGDGSWRPDPRPPEPTPLVPGGSGPGMKKLPDCLIPKLGPARPVRVLELVD
jgi:hypothetical protein